MEFAHAMLWGVDHLEYDALKNDYAISRIPSPIREKLNLKAQKNMMFASNSEIRFVMLGDEVELCLRRAPARPPIRSIGMLEVYQGDYQGSYEISPIVVGQEETVIKLQRQDWSSIRAFPLKPGGFSSEVTRVLLPYDWGCSLTYIRGEIRPPCAKELPEKRVLFYGSSITHGGNASVPSQTYVFKTVSDLGYDYINLGSAGSAYMDSVMAEYIAGRQDWEMAVIELGVNVLEDWTKEQLYHQAYYFIDSIKCRQPEKPVIVTDIYYNHCDVVGDLKISEFRSAIGSCIFELQKNYRRLYYITGTQIMNTSRGLSSDGLHPSDMGHSMIAENLAKYIKTYVL